MSSQATDISRMLPEPGRPALAYPRPQVDYLYILTAALFLLTMLVSIALVKFGFGGLPARAYVAGAIIGTTFLASPWILGDALVRMRKAALIVAICAAIGVLSSWLNDSPVAQIGRQVLEIHVQALVGLLAGACLVRTCGPGAIARVMVIAVGISGVVAALQFVGLGAAWEIRAFLQRLQPVELGPESVALVSLTLRNRAMGLSFSPVHLGTQICLAFAVWFSYLLVRYPDLIKGRIDHRLLVPIALFVLVAAVSGNRSPLLGMGVFILLYLFMVRPVYATLGLLVFLPFVVLLDDILQLLADMGVRAAQTNDGSSQNRGVLRAFGFLLLADRPYGYGLSFNSTEYWFLFWDQLKTYPNAVSIRVHALHNYFMMIVNKYGILIVFVGIYIANMFRKNFFLLLAFTPYITHIFYHNDGPLQGDFMIWYLLPAIAVTQTAALEERKRLNAAG
jgi:hypothetical protein